MSVEGLFPSFLISASGLKAQRMRMDLTSANLANAQTTRGPDGEPFKKLRPLFGVEQMDFANTLSEVENELKTVSVDGVYKDQSEPRMVYDPNHPDADEKGFVALPNINLMEEMADLLLASRAYEANTTAFNMSKNMALSAINLGK